MCTGREQLAARGRRGCRCTRWVAAVDWPMATWQTSVGWASGCSAGRSPTRHSSCVQRQAQPVAGQRLVERGVPGGQGHAGASSNTWPCLKSSKYGPETAMVPRARTPSLLLMPGVKALEAYPRIAVRARRACLSVPALPASMPEKGRAIAVDEVVLDLEDSVPADRKDEARASLIEALAAGDWAPRSVAVRINGTDSPWFGSDVSELVDGAGATIDSIVVPKVEDADQLRLLDRLIGEREPAGRSEPIALQALIETAAGLRAIDALASSVPRLEALILGPADLAASLGLPDGDPEARDEALSFARSTLLVAARAAGLAAIDGPYLRIDDEPGLIRSGERARALGYDGKWALHPRQIQPLEQLFTPSAAEVERARSVLSALDGDSRGAVSLDGEMVDEASRKRAEGCSRAPPRPSDRAALELAATLLRPDARLRLSQLRPAGLFRERRLPQLRLGARLRLAGAGAAHLRRAPARAARTPSSRPATGSSTPQGELCFSCALTRTRPADADALGLGELRVAEAAKRRLLFELGELGLPIARAGATRGSPSTCSRARSSR